MKSHNYLSFVRPTGVRGLELSHAIYEAQAFPAHFHPEYVIGAVLRGAEALDIRGVRHIVGAGDVLLIHPGEVHANSVASEQTLEYKVLYVPPELMRASIGELSFAAPAVRCPTLYASVVTVHDRISASLDPLEQQSAFCDLIFGLRGAGQTAKPFGHDATPRLHSVKAFLDDNYASRAALDDLAALAGVSAEHLVRSFKRRYGVSPVAYRNLRRVLEARRRLLAGETIADVALATGFADQSHLTREFRRIIGASPGRYADQYCARSPRR